MGTFIVSLVLVGIVALVLTYLVRQRKKGVCAGCSQCADSCPHRGEHHVN